MDFKEEFDIAGCCGIFCGLCPKYQSKAPSRCEGCRLTEAHSWCSIYKCCVVKKGFITCIECEEYPCDRYLRRGWGEDPLSKDAQINLTSIKDTGMVHWLEEQRKRRLVVEELISNYNDGRSMSFYCLACTLMPVNLVNQTISEIREKLCDNQIDDSDMKAKARSLRTIIQDKALQSGIELKSGVKKGK